eukprot:CAMPEP_0204842978 /NCGR_PEP_ID=MMETSP1346-20131115/47700_1 /ASSEMBLY_ACC=CAM_ASM_000771 /TAXON_ID=215587 /ORGANISM="Aplanochytrium stocchinoi, Strain GSBS06" /LENGTH=233 /DNA_ID=CAMNT_0051982035 /DNA_START=256 /DNA_END=958 /DNA_ORIENTATION=-
MCQSLNVSTPSIVEQILSRKRSRVQAFESKENRMVYQEVCKSIQNTKVQSTQARARKLHKKYSATINKADVSKWLTGEVIKAEKDIHRMFGAIAYAEIQLRESDAEMDVFYVGEDFKSDCDEIRFKQSFRKTHEYKPLSPRKTEWCTKKYASLFKTRKCKVRRREQENCTKNTQLRSTKQTFPNGSLVKLSRLKKIFIECSVLSHMLKYNYVNLYAEMDVFYVGEDLKVIVTK